MSVTAPGLYQVQVTVSDTQQTNTRAVNFQVNAAVPPVPQVSITSPNDSDAITHPTTLIGNVQREWRQCELGAVLCADLGQRRRDVGCLSALPLVSSTGIARSTGLPSFVHKWRHSIARLLGLRLEQSTIALHC